MLHCFFISQLPPFLSLVGHRLPEAKKAYLLPHIWLSLITFPNPLNKILSSETRGFCCIRIASLFLSCTHRHTKCSYIIKMQNTLFLSQCFQKQCFQSQHFLKPVLPLGSLKKKRFMEPISAKPDVPVSQLCATIATYSWLRSLHCAMPLLQPLHHQLPLSNQNTCPSPSLQSNTAVTNPKSFRTATILKC